MGSRTKSAWALSLGVVLVSAAAGCTISIQPTWTRPPAPAAPHGHGGEVAPGVTFPPTLVPPGMLPTGPMPKPLPGAMHTSNDAVNQLIKQYYDVDEQRRAYADQVQILNRKLKEREDSFRTASYEIEESTKQLKRTRDDFRHWQTEMDELRDRIKKLEDNRAQLKPLIEEILHHLDRQREPLKLPLLDRPLK